jgi:CspA family cold shock protein
LARRSLRGAIDLVPNRFARDVGEDVFVHYTGIEGQGFRTLHEGGRVEFTVEQTSRGLQATHVRPL